MNFSLFVLRHRFELQDIFPSVANGVTRQDLELARCFPAHQFISWNLGDGQLAELNRAFSIAQYMSENCTDEPEGLSAYTSRLREEAWAFTLRFAPYHKVHTTLENLERVHSAMLEACLSLNAAMAGMESALELHGSDRTTYTRERSRATSSLLTFSALYASYIDVCYRIRNYSGLKKSQAYSRAIKRIIGENAGEHSFAKGLRNFILHYHLVEPEITISWGEERVVKLLLDSNSLLFSGFEWNTDARNFLRSSEKIDAIRAISTVIRDVGQVIKFHRKIAERRLPQEKFAYDVYLYERARYRHLHNAVVDIGAAFHRPTSLISRVIDKGTIDQISNSSMPDDDVRVVLSALADRHRNLPAGRKDVVSREIEEFLASRRKFPNEGAFLRGQRQI